MACAVQSSTAYKNQLKGLVDESEKLVNHYQEIERGYYANMNALDKQQRLERLTLRRNLVMRQAWVEWAKEVVNELDTLD